MLDSDLAEIFGVATKVFNQAVQRNHQRFPADFMFLLTGKEFSALKSQFVTSKTEGRGGRRKLPNVFTEHGALMAANLLNSPRAAEMSVYVVRAFVRLRALVVDTKELAARLDELERNVAGHDQALQTIVAAVRQLTNPPPTPPRPRIGFSRDGKNLPT